MATISKAVTLGGKSISGAVTVTPVTEDAGQATLVAAKTGVLGTRTDNNTGTLTMTTGHGLTTGLIVDIYWVGGVQRNVTLGTVSVDSVPFDLGVGDNLPIATTAVTVGVQTAIDLDAVGSTIVIAFAHAKLKGCAGFQQNDGTVIVTAIMAAQEVWDNTTLDTNAFSGVTLGKVVVSNGDSTASNVITVGIGRNNSA
jgi:hypothetical protein